MKHANDNRGGLPPDLVRVVVWHAIVAGGDTPEYIGRDVYFVDIEDRQGGRHGVWDGLDRDAAFAEARAIGLPVAVVPA